MTISGDSVNGFQRVEELKKKLHDNTCENKEKVVSKVERTSIESGLIFYL